MKTHHSFYQRMSDDRLEGGASDATQEILWKGDGKRLRSLALFLAGALHANEMNQYRLKLKSDCCRTAMCI